MKLALANMPIVAMLRHELGSAHEQVRALEQENATMLYQLDAAKEAAERLAAQAGTERDGEGDTQRIN